MSAVEGEAEEEGAPELDEVGGEFLVSLSGRVSVLELGGWRGGRARIAARCVWGAGWRRICGPTTVLSQMADDQAGRFVFELPIDITFKSNTPFGWPQIVLVVYATNSWGVETIIGYGRTHFPIVHGESRVKVCLFAPKPVTMFATFMSWITGRNPELTDPDMLAEGDKTHLLRTSSCGYIILILNMISKGFKELNYDNVPAIYQQDREENLVAF